MLSENQAKQANPARFKGIFILSAVFIFAFHWVGILSLRGSDFFSFFSSILIILVNMAAVSLLWITAHIARNTSFVFSRMWLLFALAMSARLAGNLASSIHSCVLGLPSFPSIADLFYLASYPLFIAAYVSLPVWRRVGKQSIKLTLDTIIISVVTILIFWNYIIGPIVISGSGNPVLQQFLSLTYPTCDLLMFSAVLLAIIRLDHYPGLRSIWLMVGCGVALIFSSVSSSLYYLHSTYLFHGISTSLNLLAFILAVLGTVYHQGLVEAPPIDPAVSDDLDSLSTHPQLAYLAFISTPLPMVVLVHRLSFSMPMGMVELAIASNLVIMLMVIRMFSTTWENARLSRNLEDAMQELRERSLELEHTNLEMKAEIIERQKIEERLSYDALHDALTGLPNRVLFMDHLEHASRRHQQDPGFRFAVLFLDLDSFKVINDSLGHPIGDKLLIEVAHLLTRLTRASDTVARLGGDEFVILIEGFSQEHDVMNTASRLLAELKNPFDLDGQKVFISASVGIVHRLDSYEKPDDILRDADLAMYQAKSRGKARYEIFDIRTRSHIIERMAIENDLRHSIEAHEFELHYQPILKLPQNKLVGFEALVRWKHPTRGIVQPSDFIHITEETGLIVPLGRWILQEACREAATWQKIYPVDPPLKVNVNISAVQFKQPDFILNVAQALEETHMPGSCLVLEVTESACLENLEKVAILILSLKGMKVEVQIDDFGTGYSSLSYLHRLPVNKIKIDRSFIQSIDDTNTPDMVRAILSLVDAMGITAVAEGIENEPQITAMRNLNCAYVQGYWFARPMDRDLMHQWMKGHGRTYLDLNPPGAH